MRPVLLRFKPLYALLLAAACIQSSGCNRIPGRPGPGPEVARPDQLLDFPSLYKENCAACHGADGRGGASIPLNNPVYVAVAGENNIHQTIAKGVSGSLMPPFAQSSGGVLTDQQVTVLAQGILKTWSNPNALGGQTPLPYRATLKGDPAQGQKAFTTFCARCHGTNGTGSPGDSTMGKLGSIVDPSYLSLMSDQYLRSIIIAGRPDEGMPDSRFDGTRPLEDQQVTDIVSWLASQRTANPGQPYPSHP